jgi:hypothetical protein
MKFGIGIVDAREKLFVIMLFNLYSSNKTKMATKQECFKRSSVSVSSVNIGSVAVTLHSRAKINFHPQFPYFLTDLCKIQYRRFSHNVGEQLSVP